MATKKPKLSKTGHVCTFCGKRGAEEKRLDASRAEHWFHPACWEAFASWLAALRQHLSGVESAASPWF